MKIVRRADRAEGGLTPAEQAQLKDYAAMWIKRIERTEPIEPEKITPAIKRLYAAAGLKEPRVITVPSPLVMAVAGGISAAIWQERKNHDATYAATRAATDAATRAATYAATRAATDAATGDATRAATDAATRAATRAATDAATADATGDATRAATADATRAATYAATADATRAATYAATRAATADATGDATRAATEYPTGWALSIIDDLSNKSARLKTIMIGCIKNWYNPSHGGNHWGQWACFLSAGRDVLGLRLPIHEKYSAFEDCAIHGSWRWMHPEFCMVSDFPAVLKKDEQNRPHCADGPSHVWRDGWALWHWHGIRVNQKTIEAPHTLTIAEIDAEQNAEVRRVMMERYGFGRYLKETGAVLIDEYTDQLGHPVKLWRKEISDVFAEPAVMIELVNSTIEGLYDTAGNFTPDLKDGKEYHKSYMFFVPPDIKSARKAHAWHCGIDADSVEFIQQT